MARIPSLRSCSSNLIGVQDNIPVWTFGGVLIVAENSPNGTSVGVATATDADVNPADTLTFSEVAGGAGENVFDIDPVTGLVTVQVLDGTLPRCGVSAFV